MKQYLNYLKNNPSKVVLLILFLGFFVFINIVLRDAEFALRVGSAVFVLIVVALINLQVWGEYRGVEGFIDTVKALFKDGI